MALTDKLFTPEVFEEIVRESLPPESLIPDQEAILLGRPVVVDEVEVATPEAMRQAHVLKLVEDLESLNKRSRNGGSFEASQEVHDLADKIIAQETARVGYDIAEGNDFLLIAVDGGDHLADIGRAVEARVFADKFERSPKDVNDDYGPYDSASTFLMCIDPKRRLPAGAVRIIHPGPLGLADSNVLSFMNAETNVLKRDDNGNPTETINPWIDELHSRYAQDGRVPTEYETMQQMMFDGNVRDGATRPEEVDVASILGRTINVASLSVPRQYSRGESVPGPSVALYNCVVRTAKKTGAEFLLAIQDEKPFELLQLPFGRPFDELDLPHIPYGGEDPTVPGFCDLRTALDRMEKEAPGLAEFITQKDHYQGHPYYMFDYTPTGSWANKRPAED